MTVPDVYYGAVADNYDASREVKAKWKQETAAVERFLTHGPVLDVPFGTGRFVPIYRAKGLDFTGVDISGDMIGVARNKFPGVKVILGSAFDLNFAAGEFGTVVCVRFLEWLPLERAKMLLDRLRCLADTLIVTVTHGVEGRPEAYTYDFGKFLRAIDGLRIEDRCVTARVRDMISEVFKLRPARWADVLSQFRFHEPFGPAEHLQRIIDKHCELCGIPRVEVAEGSSTVRAEYWEPERLARLVEGLAAANAQFSTDVEPRRDNKPITVVEHRLQSLIVDGLRRAHLWMKEAGPHPILVVRPNG